MKRYGKAMALVLAGLVLVALRLGVTADACPPTPDCPCGAAGTP